MFYTPGSSVMMMNGHFGPVVGIGLAILVLWSLFWKGLALWHSAQRAHHWWFIIMLVINTLGILEIIYLFGIAKLSFSTLFTSKKPDDSGK